MLVSVEIGSTPYSPQYVGDRAGQIFMKLSLSLSTLQVPSQSEIHSETLSQN